MTPEQALDRLGKIISPHGALNKVATREKAIAILAALHLTPADAAAMMNKVEEAK